MILPEYLLMKEVLLDQQQQLCPSPNPPYTEISNAAKSEKTGML